MELLGSACLVHACLINLHQPAGRHPTRGASRLRPPGPPLTRQVSSNPLGAAVGLASTLVSALYQVLASKKQQELGLDASQVGAARRPAASQALRLERRAARGGGRGGGPDVGLAASMAVRSGHDPQRMGGQLCAGRLQVAIRRSPLSFRRSARLATPPAPPRHSPRPATQLLHQSMPAAAVMLAGLVPLMEPLGLACPLIGGAWGGPGTLLGYRFTVAAIVAILGSAGLG
jgi:hypothetical protein